MATRTTGTQMSQNAVPADEETQCCTFTFCKAVMLTIVDLHFVVIPDLEENIKSVLNEYRGWWKESFRLNIGFNSNTTVQLGLQEQTADSYRIRQLSSPNQITFINISRYRPGKRIPHIALEIEFVRETQHQLSHKVDIIGVTPPNSFCIRYPQPKDNIVQPSRVTTPPSGTHADTGLSSASSSDSHHQQNLQGPDSYEVPFYTPYYTDCQWDKPTQLVVDKYHQATPIPHIDSTCNETENELPHLIQPFPICLEQKHVQ